MTRLRLVTVLVLGVALLLPGAAFAKKKNKAKMSDNFQAGLDLGAYIYGAIPYASVTFNDQDASFSGTGGFGPIIGAHFNMFAAEDWILHFDIAYSYQSGKASIDFDDEKLNDQDFDYGLEMFRASVGAGKRILATRFVNPYWMLGLGLHHMAFQEKDEDEAATGTGVGPFGALGVDAIVTKTKGMHIFVGGQGRLDIIYTVTPLERDKAEITMAYVPLAFILTGGVQF
ncbi:MAG: porin family protein [Deltaproteobacteria bacterium]|nr:porin family protein [Deltaproteobacteria bacterium]